MMIWVKGEYLAVTQEVVREHLPYASLLNTAQTYRLGAHRFDLLLSEQEVLSVYKWYNEGGGEAPFPDGTLLFFQISP